MKSQLIDPMSSISVIGFLHAFKMACDTNSVDKGAPVWLVSLFIKETASAALKTRLSLEANASQEPLQEGMLKSYKQVFKRLLETYTTDDVNAKVDLEILPFTQPTKMSLVQYADTLRMKALTGPTNLIQVCVEGNLRRRSSIFHLTQPALI